ncbi:MAG: lipopolysaccharide cholinephosphotransferase [Clostridiales bacterium]|jgi:phosphorylcholine metabolism protein LicD|uniref:LicD family protein n=1 Tax=Bovifimicola ammoniilytica TaxID=2981720 RepID=UPI00033B6589|nr:LicD family protein [Bovifimicola ammoniilytica]MBD8943065.1 lipopolysaccharide cholinephosphotransferase [Clostridiales bacterium]MCU6753483.1 LicD family protein [Bovifimicola ammoniilytica]CCZ03871.1 putative LicD-family phosphotransferase [Eubacterium sp. CAG:603]SCJ65118.1 LPS biosynthesis protein [uncultured Eubacterium sp.]
MKLSTVAAFKNINSNSDKFIHIKGDVLKNFQKELLKMMQDIVTVCEEEKIAYCLLGGSALGAVRHKGFIPWDDDMDIGMPAYDFERFRIAFLKKFGEKYWVHYCKTKDYGMTVNRIRLKGSVCRGREDTYTEECGFFIDIFLMENTFDNKILYNIHGFFCMAFGFLLSCRMFYKNRELMSELAEANPDLKSAFKIKIFIGRLLSFISIKKLTCFTQKIYGLCKNNNSKYVSIPSGRKHYFKETYLRDGQVQVTKCEFEGHKWNIPKDYDAYLKKMYGDYMKIPPEKDREEHIVLELKFPEN